MRLIQAIKCFLSINIKHFINTRKGNIMEIFNSEAYSKYVLALFNNDTKQNREAIAEAFGTSDWKDLHEEFGETPYESVQDFYARHQGMIFD